MQCRRLDRNETYATKMTKRPMSSASAAMPSILTPEIKENRSLRNKLSYQNDVEETKSLLFAANDVEETSFCFI